MEVDVQSQKKRDSTAEGKAIVLHATRRKTTREQGTELKRLLEKDWRRSARGITPIMIGEK